MREKAAHYLQKYGPKITVHWSFQTQPIFAIVLVSPSQLICLHLFVTNCFLSMSTVLFRQVLTCWCGHVSLSYP